MEFRLNSRCAYIRMPDGWPTTKNSRGLYVTCIVERLEIYIDLHRAIVVSMIDSALGGFGHLDIGLHTARIPAERDWSTLGVVFFCVVLQTNRNAYLRTINHLAYAHADISKTVYV